MGEGFFKKLFGGGSKKPSEPDPSSLPGATMTWTEGGQQRRLVLDERILQATQSAVEAAALLEARKLDEALQKAQMAGKTLDQYPGPDDDQVINTADMLGIMFRMFGFNEEAERMFQRAANALDEQGGSNTKKLCGVLKEWGQILLDRGAATEAKPKFERLLSIQKELNGPFHKDTAEATHFLAVCICDSGDPASAIPLFRQAVDLRVRTCGENSVDTAKSLDAFARALLQKDQVDDARSAAQRALKIRQSLLEPGHPDIARAMVTLSSAYSRSGDLDPATAYLHQAVAIFEAAKHHELGMAINNLAGVLMRKKDYDGAQPLLEKALALKEQSLGRDHPSVAFTLKILAICHASKAEFAAALPPIRRAFDIYSRTFGSNNPNTVECKGLLEDISADAARTSAPSPRAAEPAPRPSQPQEQNAGKKRMYVPSVKAAKEMRRFDAAHHYAVFYTDITPNGLVEYEYILAVYDKATDEPVFFVTSEDNLHLKEFPDGGSHFLCLFVEERHLNLGSSDEWADMDKFLDRAIELVQERISVSLEETNL